MTIDAEVHPKASTSKGIPGKIIPAVSAILPSMAANVSLVTFTSFLIRLWYKDIPGIKDNRVLYFGLKQILYPSAATISCLRAIALPEITVVEKWMLLKEGSD